MGVNEEESEKKVKKQEKDRKFITTRSQRHFHSTDETRLEKGTF